MQPRICDKAGSMECGNIVGMVKCEADLAVTADKRIAAGRRNTETGLAAARMRQRTLRQIGFEEGLAAFPAGQRKEGIERRLIDDPVKQAVAGGVYVEDIGRAG